MWWLQPPFPSDRKYFDNEYTKNLCVYCSFSKAVKKRQPRSFSENLCFPYTHAKLHFFMSSSMDLLDHLTAMEIFVFNSFLRY